MNVRINKLVHSIWALLGDAAARRHFGSGERAWRNFVRSDCIASSRSYIDPRFPHQYVGGSEAPVLFAYCEQNLALEHERDLVATAAQLGPH